MMHVRIIFLLASVLFSLPAMADAQALLRESEKLEIEKNKNIVMRDGDSLSLLLNSKAVLGFTDDDCNLYTRCLTYVYKGLLANNQFFVLDKHQFGTSTTILISRNTGQQYDIIAPPHLSPDGKFILTVSGTEPKWGVFVWEIHNGALAERLYYDPSEVMLFQFVRWNAYGSAELTKTIRDEDCQTDRNIREVPVLLVVKSGQWALEDISKGNCLN